MTSKPFIVIAKTHSLCFLPNSLAVQTSPTIHAVTTCHLFFLGRRLALPYGIHNPWCVCLYYDVIRLEVTIFHGCFAGLLNGKFFVRMRVTLVRCDLA